MFIRAMFCPAAAQPAARFRSPKSTPVPEAAPVRRLKYPDKKPLRQGDAPNVAAFLGQYDDTKVKQSDIRGFGEFGLPTGL
jgi:hypothetical protein